MAVTISVHSKNFVFGLAWRDLLTSDKKQKQAEIDDMVLEKDASHGVLLNKEIDGEINYQVGLIDGQISSIKALSLYSFAAGLSKSSGDGVYFLSLSPEADKVQIFWFCVIQDGLISTDGETVGSYDIVNSRMSDAFNNTNSINELKFFTNIDVVLEKRQGVLVDLNTIAEEMIESKSLSRLKTLSGTNPLIRAFVLLLLVVGSYVFYSTVSFEDVAEITINKGANKWAAIINKEVKDQADQAVSLSPEKQIDQTINHYLLALSLDNADMKLNRLWPVGVQSYLNQSDKNFLVPVGGYVFIGADCSIADNGCQLWWSADQRSFSYITDVSKHFGFELSEFRVEGNGNRINYFLTFDAMNVKLGGSQLSNLTEQSSVLNTIESINNKLETLFGNDSEIYIHLLEQSKYFSLFSKNIKWGGVKFKPANKEYDLIPGMRKDIAKAVEGKLSISGSLPVIADINDQLKLFALSPIAFTYTPNDSTKIWNIDYKLLALEKADIKPNL